MNSTQDDPNATESGDDGDDGDGATESTVTASVQPDQEDVTALQEEIQGKIQAGELNQTEAQRQYQQRQLELIRDAASAFESSVEGDDSVVIEDSIVERGVFLVSGNPDALIGELTAENVSALIPASQFEALQEQQQSS